MNEVTLLAFITPPKLFFSFNFDAPIYIVGFFDYSLRKTRFSLQ